MHGRVLRMMIAVILVIGAVPGLSAGAHSFGEPHFERTWARTDLPVSQDRVDRTWMWGPEGHTEAFMEPYADAPGGERLVQYTDKSRMEDNSFRADRPWDVTNGLVALELITGAMQLGDNEFEQHDPAEVQVAGDAHPESPTYATFSQVLDQGSLSSGSTITQTIDQSGNVGNDDELAEHGVTAEHHVPDTDHTVASVFWEFMNSSGQVYQDGQFVQDGLFENPFFATGLPVTEAYWMNIPVAGEWHDVLGQCFERRCLTFTPGNPDGWQVEAGNIGQHYYEWRYGETPPPPPEENGYVPVMVGEDVTVAYNNYGLPDGLGYNAAAVFYVTNRNPGLAAVELNYRVTFYAKGEQIFTSDGQDQVTIEADDERPVVHYVSGTNLPVDLQPDAAEVEIFDDPNAYTSDPDLSARNQWETSNQEVQCDSGTVQCDALGDLTWHGNETQWRVDATIVVYEGDDTSGAPIAAGHEMMGLQEVEPGQTIPHSIMLTGFDQPEEAGAAVAPEEIMIKTYVQSDNAGF